MISECDMCHKEKQLVEKSIRFGKGFCLECWTREDDGSD